MSLHFQKYTKGLTLLLTVVKAIKSYHTIVNLSTNSLISQSNAFAYSSSVVVVIYTEVSLKEAQKTKLSFFVP